MGDRVSISFKTGDEESVVLFCHWGGMEFVKQAKAYAKELIQEVGSCQVNPLERLEPNTVMVDFIRYHLDSASRVMSNYYLGKDSEDGDNSDNGHHVIELSKVPVKKLALGYYEDKPAPARKSSRRKPKP